MARRGGERLTLVIENDVVRLMGVEKGEVTRWGSAPLPRGTLSSGAVANPDALAEAVTRLWSSQTQDTFGHKPSPSQFILGIPGHHIPTKIVSVQGLNTKDKALMKRKAQEALPGMETYRAWQVVGPAKQPGLFVIAAPTKLIKSYLDTLKGIGIGVIAIDVKPLALIRAIGQRHAVIVDGGRALASIIIVDEALPRRARFPSLDAPLLVPLEEKITRLAERLIQTIHAYNNDKSSQVLHPAVPFFLTGSLADHPLLRQVVEQILRHPVGQIKSPIKVPPDMPINQFMTNIGLAQKQL
jgi:hypothetical protein